MKHHSECVCQGGWICPMCYEEACNEIHEQEQELKKCYSEIADKESIIVKMMTMAKTDVVYVDGHETFFQISSINEQEKTVDLVGFDYDLDDVGFDEITSLFKKCQL